MPFELAAKLAGEQWAAGLNEGTRRLYQRDGVPTSAIANDLWRWYRGERGEVPKAKAAEPDPEALRARIDLLRRYYVAVGAQVETYDLWIAMGVGMENGVKREEEKERIRTVKATRQPVAQPDPAQRHARKR